VSKVLVFCPTYRHNAETLYAVNGLAHDGVCDFFFSRDNPHRGAEATKNILHQFKKAQALAAEYDYILTIEDDMMPPADGLTKLRAAMDDTGAGAVYGVYHFRRPSPAPSVMDKRTGEAITPRQWKKAFSEQAVIECGGMGYGFTLFRADLFRSVTLRTQNGSGADSDTHLSADLRKAGVKQLAHFGVLCGHKMPDGAALWPSEERDAPRVAGKMERKLVSVRALSSVSVKQPSGGFAPILQGDTGEVESELAEVLAGAGIVAYA